MSEQEIRVFSEGLHHGFGQAREFRSLSMERDAGPPVLLREVVSAGEFGRTINCLPGRLVVLLANQSGDFEPFRLVLTGKPSEKPVQMRYGPHPLDPSEIHVAGRVELFWKQTTLKGIIRAVGVPDSLSAALLEVLELSDCLQHSPAQLGSGAIHRLAIACSFFTRSRLLVYDAPFQNVDESWVPRLAELILDGTREGCRITVATGVRQLPDAWRAHPLVDVFGGEQQPAAPAGAAASRILQDRRAVEERSASLVTRPQHIPGRTKPIYEQLGAEVIRNPNTEEELHTGEREAEAPPVKTFPARKQGAEKKLTKVTGVYRLSHRPWILKLRSLLPGRKGR